MIHNKAEMKHHLFNSNYCSTKPTPTFQFNKPPAPTVAGTRATVLAHSALRRQQKHAENERLNYKKWLLQAVLSFLS